MKREILNIKHFNAGIISSTDSEDIPNDAAQDSSALDPIADGKLASAELATSGTSLGSTTISVLSYLNNDGSYEITANNTGGGITGATSMVPHNEEIHAGGSSYTWYGYIRHKQFGVSPSSSVYSLDGRVDNWLNKAGNAGVSASGATIDAGDGYFRDTSEYRYTITFIYDSTQESELLPTIFGKPILANNYSTVDVTITVTTSTSPTNWRRITGVNLYRQEKSSGESPFTEWKLIQSIDLTETNQGFDTWVNTSGSDWEITYTDDGNFGVGYEQNSGIAETLEVISPTSYELGEESSGYHFISEPTFRVTDDFTGTIHRSLAGRYGMFNWTKDLIKIPFTPKALMSFNNRIYAMDEARIEVINPIGLFPEKKIIGAGCSSPNSFTIAENRAYFANEESIFMYDGAVVHDLTLPIEADWKALSGTPIVVYDGLKKQVIFAKGTTFYIYHTIRKRWDKLPTSFARTARVTKPTGEAVTAYGSSGLYITPLHGGTQQTFSWTSKKFDMGEPGEDKKFYFIKVNSNTVNPYLRTQFRIDGGSWTTLNSDYETKISADWAKGRHIEIKFNGTTVSEEITSFEIIYRRLSGHR